MDIFGAWGQRGCAGSGGGWFTACLFVVEHISRFVAKPLQTWWRYVYTPWKIHRWNLRITQFLHRTVIWTIHLHLLRSTFYRKPPNCQPAFPRKSRVDVRWCEFSSRPVKSLESRKAPIKPKQKQRLILTYCWWRKSGQFIGSLSHYLQGFIHPRWCRISSINSILTLKTWEEQSFCTLRPNSWWPMSWESGRIFFSLPKRCWWVLHIPDAPWDSNSGNYRIWKVKQWLKMSKGKCSYR